MRIIPKIVLLVFSAIALAGCVSTGGAFGVSGPDRGHRVVASSGAALPAAAIAVESERMSLGETRGASVAYASNEPVGTIVIETARPGLYVIEGNGRATRFPVAVGRKEHQWYGEKTVESVHLRPAWSPPAIVRAASPNLPDVIPSGASNNPMGLGAIVLTGGEYAIHGTNRPDSIGQAVSFGCFRMFNEDVAELLLRVRVGTRVVVK
jgi:lipoprotein-anchoring transpeptidase ErfK/SrfK